MEIVFFAMIACVIYAIGYVIVYSIFEKNKGEQNYAKCQNVLSNFIKNNSLKIDTKVVIEKYFGKFPRNEKFLMYVDRTKQKFIFMDCKDGSSSVNCYSFNDLIDFKLTENNAPISAGRGMMAAAGGLVAGTTGAVVGSVFGSKVQKNYCEELAIELNLNSFKMPLVKIKLSGGCKTDDVYYQHVLESAKKLISLLAVIQYSTLKEEHESAVNNMDTIVSNVETNSSAASIVAGIEISAPFPGTVKNVKVKVGDTVESGDVLLSIHALWMDNEIMTPNYGTVGEVRVVDNQTVNTGDILIVIT